jgi:hypothetical protein
MHKIRRMKIRQRTEVRMVTHETTVVRLRNAPTYCASCDEIAPYLSLREATLIMAISGADLIRLAENGQVHHLENSDGSLLICGNSAAEFDRGYTRGSL